MSQQGAMLAPIRLTNAAAQLPCGSGETQGDASPPYSTPLPPLRGFFYRTVRTSVMYRQGAMQASPPSSAPPPPLRGFFYRTVRTSVLTFRISDCPYLFADRLLQQITLDTYRGQQLCLCLRSERQPPQFDETQRSIVVELITTIIRCQAVVIERMLRFAPNDSAMPRLQLYAHHATDKTL